MAVFILSLVLLVLRRRVLRRQREHGALSENRKEGTNPGDTHKTVQIYD
jgi:hypothetical protein